MIHRIILTAFCCIATLSASAQHIEAKSHVINLGQVAFRQPVVAEYELHNKSSHAMKIWKVYTSCGCTTADYPTGNIQGGSNFTLRVTYDANQMGHFEKEIAVYTNDGINPLILTLKGIVVEEVVDYIGDYAFQLGELKVDQKFDFINTIRKGEELNILKIETKEAETAPPTRYNSGSIILAMENAGKLIEDEELREQIKGAGIGTSATRGEIIKKLENYINSKFNKLVVKM